jgi:hypothetical protein
LTNWLVDRRFQQTTSRLLLTDGRTSTGLICAPNSQTYATVFQYVLYVQHLCTCMYSVFRTYIHILHLVVVISKNIDIFHYTYMLKMMTIRIADSILVHSNYFHRAVLGCCKRRSRSRASASHAESVIPFNFECTRIAVHLFCSQERCQNEMRQSGQYSSSVVPNCYRSLRAMLLHQSLRAMLLH